jgi:hypothetical protein
MSEQIPQDPERSEGDPMGGLELEAEQAEGVKGGAEPINTKPAEHKAGPTNYNKKNVTIK